MKFTVNRTELLAAAQNAERIAPRVSTIEILQCAHLQAEQDTLIHQHAHEPIRTGQLAQALGISREYLSRTFKAVEGISLRAYIRDSKIKTAEKLLRHSERSILDISRYLGFSSQSHFTESFKAETGTTPQEYRRIFRET